MLIKITKQFLKQEAAGGILLFCAAFLAICFDNSRFAALYNAFLHIHLPIYGNAMFLAQPLSAWINDGLMVLFFLTVGLELKREMCCGHLSKISNVILPLVVALGGMIFPALIYMSLNFGNSITIKGWAIPVATDIAFVLAVLSLLGRRVPASLKLFLLAVAIFDDIGAIVIIAVFHTHNLSWLSLGSALVVIFLLLLLNVFRIEKITLYMLLGFVLWICVLKSGVHATLAGIILAFTIPINSNIPGKPSPLHRLEAGLIPWVSFVILPLFGFVNAGISFVNTASGAFSNTVVWGIVLGLLVGKQIGVFLFTWICVKLRLCRLPQQTTWLNIYAIAVLCGVGFTMSLFIGTLTFTGQNLENFVSVRLGVLVATIIAGVCGYGLLYISLRGRHHES